MAEDPTAVPISSPEGVSVGPATKPPEAATVEAAQNLPRLNLLTLVVLAFAVGVISGTGAVVFRGLIGGIHNLLFLGRFSFVYDARHFTPADPFGALIILVPVIGSFGVTWLVSNFAPEAKGHGVPEVMDAIYYNRGVIRPVVAVVKSIASALAIGSGAAVGREGPIVQIGSAFGSMLGQIIRMQTGQRITLIAAGAGAGIAATFNTPIGGVLFATELMLPEVSVDTFLPVAVATGTATFIGRIFFGNEPAFNVPVNLAALPNGPSSVAILVVYALLGVFVGVAAAGFVRILHLLEDGFDLIGGRYLRHALGMLIVGVAMYVFWLTKGHYFIEGVSYDTIQATLHDQIIGAGFLLILFGAKLLATTVSLGSGSSGGIFSPSLFMGATLGAAFASLVTLLFPAAPVSLPAFAMVGMGAMVGGATGAAMTAVTMIFEMTRDYSIVLPMILAVAMALGVRRLLCRESIYTMKLARRGHPLPRALQTNIFLVQSARDIMETDVLVLDESTLFSTFLGVAAAQGGLRHVVITRAGKIIGGIRINLSIRRAVGGSDETRLGDLVGRNFIIVSGETVAFDVIKSMTQAHAAMAIVVDMANNEPDKVVGVITKEHIADTVSRSVQLYPG